MSRLFVFIHVPKTGGTSIRNVFTRAGRGHTSLTEWHLESQHLHHKREYFVVAFIRNPWDRLHSWYRHERMFDKMDFEQYVLTVAKGEIYVHGRKSTPHEIARQECWMESPHRVLDFVGHFEHLEYDFAKMCAAIGKIPLPVLPHKNRTEAKDNYPYSPDLWTPEMLAVMAPVFEPFAEKYGYTSP